MALASLKFFKLQSCTKQGGNNTIQIKNPNKLTSRNYHRYNRRPELWDKAAPATVDERIGVWDPVNKKRIQFPNELWYGREYNFWNESPYDPPQIFHPCVVELEPLYQDITTTPSSKMIHMNRTKQLNSFNLEFTTRLRKLFEKYGNQVETSYGTWLKGKDTIFSSGTDFIELYNNMSSGPEGLAKVSKFFSELYNLSNALFNSRVPSYFMNDGLTLGSAASVSIVSGSNVATERTVLAWPETELGFFPDAGATWKLAQLPFVGTYLALTGSRIEGQNAELAGLAKYSMDPYQSAHLRWSFDSHPGKNQQLRELYFFCNEMETVPYALRKHLRTIYKCFSGNTMEEIMDALKHEAEVEENPWAERKLRLLEKKSPVSLKITLRLLREAQKKTLQECLQTEYVVAHNLLLDRSSDFYKGVTSLIALNKNPDHTSAGIKVNWNNKSVYDVKDEEIDRYFKPLDSSIAPLYVDPPRLTSVQNAMKKFNNQKRALDYLNQEEVLEEFINQAYKYTSEERIAKVVDLYQVQLQLAFHDAPATRLLETSIKLLKDLLRNGVPTTFTTTEAYLEENLDKENLEVYMSIRQRVDHIRKSMPIFENRYLYLRDEIPTAKNADEEYQGILRGDYAKYQSPFKEKALNPCLDAELPMDDKFLLQFAEESGIDVKEYLSEPDYTDCDIALGIGEENFGKFKYPPPDSYENSEVDYSPSTNDKALYEDQLPPELYKLTCGDRVATRFLREFTVAQTPDVNHGLWEAPNILSEYLDVIALKDYFGVLPQTLGNNRVKKNKRIFNRDNRIKDTFKY